MADILRFADVSSAQGADISSIISANDGVIVKATEGNYYLNTQWSTQVSQVNSAGKKLGIYHFLNGDVDPTTQAQYLLDNIGQYATQANVPIILDFENNGTLKADGSRQYPVLTGNEIKPFVDYIKNKTGKTVMIYANVSDTKKYSLISYGLPLWVAGYPYSTPVDYSQDLQTWADSNYFSGYRDKVTMWQFSSNPYDKSVYYGSSNDWDKLSGITSNSKNGTPIVQYPDASGNRAYAKTHWQAIDGKPDLISKDDLNNLNIHSSGLQLNSSDGTTWNITVNNDGTVTASKPVQPNDYLDKYQPMTFEFDNFWGYSGNDLGYTYTLQATTIRLWAPTATSVDLLIYDNPNSDNVNRTYRMTRGIGFNQNDHSANTIGVWSVTLSGDYGQNIGTAYRYSLTFPDGHKTETQDPYTTAVSYGGDKSIILDSNNGQTPNGFTTNYTGRVDSPTQAIIGEMSIRDFTKSDTSGVDQNKRGKFLGACQPGTKNPNFGQPTGFDHVKSLGLNYIQVMPMFSTYSGDANSSDYSWGYDPKNYNAPTTGFASNPQDPRSAIYDLKTMIKAYHDAGIGVTMDVVYNHVGGDAMQSPFEKTVPGYYFRKNADGSLSNGSYCGNDFRSEAEMSRKFILDSVKHWQSTYGIDGFRFDLLGIIDTTTSKRIEAAFAGKNILLYGEGWNRPTNLPENLKSMNDNSSQIPSIGFFNGTYRDQIIGTSSQPGFVFGNSSYRESDIVNSLLASDFSQMSQNLQYVEVHDDRTLSDNNWYHNPDDDEKTHEHRMALANAMVMLAQGMSLIQIGQDFWRNKKMNDNSYNAGDVINALNWDYLQYHADTVQMMRDVIALKKNEKHLQLTNRSDLARFVSIDNDINGSKVISMTIQASDGGKKVILLNGSNTPVVIGSGASDDPRLKKNYADTNFDYSNYMISSANVTKENGAITIGAIGYVVVGFSG